MVFKIYDLQQPLDCRGRNGWFIAREVELWEFLYHIELGIRSNRPSDIAPIIVKLSPVDAIALGGRLIEAGRNLQVAAIEEEADA